MHSELQLELYEHCCDGLRELHLIDGKSDSDAARLRIRAELGALSRANVLSNVEILARCVDFARAEGLAIRSDGRSIASMVLYAIGLSAFSPLEHGLYYESWHNDSTSDPFRLPGGISSTLHGREVLGQFLQNEKAYSLTQWISVSLMAEAEEILLETVGREEFNEVEHDVKQLMADANRPIPRCLVEHLPFLNKMPRARELIQCRLFLSDIAALYALNRRKTIDAGLMDAFVHAKVDNHHFVGKPESCAPLFEANGGSPVFREEMAEILKINCGISFGDAIRFVTSFANSHSQDQADAERGFRQIVADSSDRKGISEEMIAFVVTTLPYLFPKTLAYDIAANSLRRAAFKKRFAEDWQSAQEIAREIFVL